MGLSAGAAMANVVAAWDFNDAQTTAAAGWTTVSASTLTDGGSTISNITVQLTGGTLVLKSRDIGTNANFVADGPALVSLSTSTDDQAVYEDYIKVKQNNPVLTISGLTPGQEYAIQWIGTFGINNQQISVTQDGALVSRIKADGVSAQYDVVYSTHYMLTAAHGDTDVEFGFKGVNGGYDERYGISGLVIRSIPDVTAPTITALNPLDDSTHVMVDGDLEVTFSEPIEVGSGTITIQNLTDGTTEAVIPVTDVAQVSVAGAVLTIDPVANLDYSKDYAVLIDAGAVEDGNSNSFTGITDELTWNFTTRELDNIAPHVTALSPLDDSTNVVVGADLAVTFSEPIVVGSGNITIANLTDGTTEAVIPVTDSSQVYVYGEVLMINPTDDLTASKDYAVLMDAGAVKDESLNPFAGITDTTTWNFTAIEPRGPNIILIYSDDHGYTDLGLFGIDPYVDTPNMDALATGGALMTQGYSSAPQCRPSRVGLMAGRIQNEFGFDDNKGDAGEGEGTMPRNYPAGSDMAGKPLLTIGDRMKALGYVTGFTGKWHCGRDNNAKYAPRARGFDEYWVGELKKYWANFDLDGNSIPLQQIEKTGNRVIVMGAAAEAFIERNTHHPFFLYLPFYAPHVPLISTNDKYYKNFPVVDYPHYDDADDDVRRKGLALIKAMDVAIGGVVDKLRDLGLEENTLILFCGDNGAPGGGAWNGSDNVPMRGVKGDLLEGGIRVPMFAYWKGTILPGQVIDEMVTALDFTATSVATRGGTVPPEFDGVDIIPRLTGQEPSIMRTKPMFWDFEYSGEQAVRKGDWKLWRNATGDRLFNIAADPMELFDLALKEPAKAAELGADLDAWCTPLLDIIVPEGEVVTAKNKLKPESKWGMHVTGNAVASADPRYRVPYGNSVLMSYPAAILKIGATLPVDTDGDGANDTLEYEWGRNPFNGIDGTVDADADGQSDLFEMIAGYSPDNGNDVFTSNVAVTPGNTVRLVYDGKAGRTYVVEATTDLVDWDVVDTKGPVVGDGLQVLDEPMGTNRFYRVKVTYP